MVDTDVSALLDLYAETIARGNTTLPDLARIDRYAAEKHMGQQRKDGSPYIAHPRSVCQLAAGFAKQLGQDDYGVAACAGTGLLHDCSEDQGVDFEDLVEVSNTEVALLVSFVSDDKRLPSALRHDRYLERLTLAPLRAQIVKLADLTDNSRDSLLLLDREHLARRVRDTQGGLTLTHAIVQQQLERNKAAMTRWARKARDIAAVLGSVTNLSAHAAVVANIDLLSTKATAL